MLSVVVWSLHRSALLITGVAPLELCCFRIWYVLDTLFEFIGWKPLLLFDVLCLICFNKGEFSVGPWRDMLSVVVWSLHRFAFIANHRCCLPCYIMFMFLICHFWNVICFDFVVKYLTEPYSQKNVLDIWLMCKNDLNCIKWQLTVSQLNQWLI